jgi:DNA-directed RNA polymerase subunit RPC12/RpoP
MADLPSSLAGRRCPDCGTVQPLYVSRGSGIALQRGAADVVACPGCGARLRLEADPKDPGGVIAGLVMIVTVTGMILGTAFWAAERDLGSGLVGIVVAGQVGLAVLAAIWWNGVSARRRRVVRADEEAP